jgi:aminomethyltransferase
MCVLGDNIIGVANWQQIPIEQQYSSLSHGAGAFVASNMQYLEICGPDAAAAINMLTPRNILELQVGRAKFVLFTTPTGTVDDEAIVLRTGAEHFFISCGGGKSLTWLPEALEAFPATKVINSKFVSFNLKGPNKIAAMQSLVREEYREALSALHPFQSCKSQTLNGDSVIILRTVVGIEMWGEGQHIRRTWANIVKQPELITPCGWDVLGVFRMECALMVFALFPLDVHKGTTLWEAGYGWMVEKGKDEYFLGQQALQLSKGKERFRLCGLMAMNSNTDAPPVGTPVHAGNGDIAGYVTSSAFSVKYGRALSFAYLDTQHESGATLAVDGHDDWITSSLPFNSSATVSNEMKRLLLR